MYYEKVAGYEEDGLIANSAIQSIVHNVKVSAAVVRGQLICKGTDGKYSPVTENADAAKVLAIAATNFTPTDDNNVTQAYVRGAFNVEKVYVGTDPPYSLGALDSIEVLVGENLDLETFREALRVQGIWLTSLKGE